MCLFVTYLLPNLARHFFLQVGGLAGGRCRAWNAVAAAEVEEKGYLMLFLSIICNIFDH